MGRPTTEDSSDANDEEDAKNFDISSAFVGQVAENSVHLASAPTGLDNSNPEPEECACAGEMSLVAASPPQVAGRAPVQAIDRKVLSEWNVAPQP